MTIEQSEPLVISGTVGSNEAMRLVTSLARDTNVTIEADVLYPYHYFDARCSVPTLTGQRLVPIACLVDAINGIGATTDHFQFTNSTSPTGKLLPGTLDQASAAEIAQRTVTHRLGRQLRMIASFDVRLVVRGLVYKRFWIVRAGLTQVMVDSTTGNLHPLGLRAA